jgi:hypothetical protein
VTFVSAAPLEEVEYSSREQLDSGGGGSVGSNNSTLRQQPAHHSQHQQLDLHRQLLNIPLTSEGSNSNDSHNDSGYSTRMGFSAGPSPSLSGRCSDFFIFFFISKSFKFLFIFYYRKSAGK